jgi:hypothetical protein
MRTLTNAELLALWERGRMLHPIDQGLLAVHAAFPESSTERIADWPLGRRNRALAELRCACFGPRLQGWIACPQCDDKLEFELDARTIAAPAPLYEDGPIVVHGQAFRLPSSRDLASIAGETDASAAVNKLLERCRIESALEDTAGQPLEAGSEGGTEDRTEKSTGTWTEEQWDAVGERMAQADPVAEILLSFVCPVCGGRCQESLDLPSFLWAEMEGQAKRLLLDIHTLASAYGWTEAEILALSATRRGCYLEMVHA